MNSFRQCHLNTNAPNIVDSQINGALPRRFAPRFFSLMRLFGDIFVHCVQAA